MAKQKKEKRVILSKEEVLAKIKGNAAFMDKLKFVKERFWPALIEGTTSIEDATALLSGFNTQIMQTFLAEMKNKKMSDLKLETMLDKTNPLYDKHIAMISLFDDMSVFDAKDYIEGMRGEIDLFKREEFETRSLSTLKTKWADEL